MEKIIHDDFNSIKEILQEINNESHVVESKRYNNIYFYNDSGDVYIKFNRKQVILSRISLEKQRQGYGTRILNILKDYCKKYSIEELVIESVLTDEMLAFCKKHGFMKVENDYSCYIGNYLLKIEG